MRKVIILEECDYNLIMSSLRSSKDVLKHMSQTKNSRRVASYVDEAIRLLTEEDSSVRDMKNRISDIELQIED